MPAHEDHAAAEKADADGYSLNGADGVSVEGVRLGRDPRDSQLSDGGVERGADGDQHVGAKTGCLPRALALPAEHSAERGRNEETSQQFELGMHRSLGTEIGRASWRERV